MTVAEALSYYGEHHAPTTACPSRIGETITALLPYWGEKPLTDITPITCRAYGLQRGVADGTLRREFGTLSAAQNFMVKNRRLTSSVAPTLPPKPQPKDRWLTVYEAALLLNAARCATGRSRAYLPLFMLIALYTGARKEAILSLRWPQIDMERQRIDFAIPGRVETKKRRPTLPIPNRLMTFLHLAWKRRSSDFGPVLHIDGKPIKRIDKGFREKARSVGLHDVTPHVLRHTRGTWLAQQGVSMWDIAGWLGDTVETVSKNYAHHSPDFMQEALRATERRVL